MHILSSLNKECALCALYVKGISHRNRHYLEWTGVLCGHK